MLINHWKFEAITKEKGLTIPRLELLLEAAVIATQIKHHITEDVQANLENVFLWSDAKIVLKCEKLILEATLPTEKIKFVITPTSELYL